MFPRWSAAVAAALLSVLLSSGPAAADQAAPDKTLKVVISAVNLVELDGEIRTVIVANPEIADATVLGPHRLYLLGKQPGQTSLLVTDAAGTPLLDATLLVAKPDIGVVTLDRGVRESTLSCTPRCIVTEEAKGGDTPSQGAGQPPSGPPSPPSAPSSPPGSGEPSASVPGDTTPGSKLPHLKPPLLEFSP